MKKKALSFGVLLVTLVWRMPALPLAEIRRPGIPVQQRPSWPNGLADLLNSGGQVYGYYLNWDDHFFFAGDTEDFNEFLQRCAKLKGGPTKLILHPGQGNRDTFEKRYLPSDGTIRFDWKVTVPQLVEWDKTKLPASVRVTSSGEITVELWLGGQVDLSKVEVPLNLKVESGGEIEKFIAAHKLKGKQEAESETPPAVPVETTAKPETPDQPPPL